MPNNVKYKIAETFYEMVRRKGIDKITVTDLVEECQISRPTFYYHFQDIYSVLEWITEQKVETTLQQSIKAKTPEEAIRIFVQFCVRDRDVIGRMLQSQKREYIEKIIVEGIQRYLIGMLQHKNPEARISLSEGQLAIEFCSYGIAGICMNHSSDKDFDEDKIVTRLMQLTEAVSFEN